MKRSIMRRAGERSLGDLLLSIGLMAVTGMAGCVPQPVIPSGRHKVTINTEEAMADYRAHVQKTGDERRERSLMERKLEVLNEQVSELRGVVTFLQLKTQDYDRLLSGPMNQTVERDPQRTVRPSRFREGTGKSIQHDEKPALTGASPLSGKSDGITKPALPVTSTGEGVPTGEHVVTVKPLSGPLVPVAQSVSDSPVRSAKIDPTVKSSRNPIEIWFSPQEKMEVRHHGITFRVRPEPGSSEFKMNTAFEAYLMKAAKQNFVTQIRSYSDGAEAGKSVEDVTKERAEAMRFMLEQWGVSPLNIDMKLYPLNVLDEAGHEIPVKHRKVEVEFMAMDPSAVYPAWKKAVN